VKTTRLYVDGNDTGISVWVAETTRERMRGLLGRDHLPPDEGLLLKPCRSIHTFGMGFPIDVLFLDRHQRIVAIHRDVPKRRMLFNHRASQTLEMSAGSSERNALSVGAGLVFKASS
jgi:uncharacterized protein